jgi:hypothetical protein
MVELLINLLARLQNRKRLRFVEGANINRPEEVA